MPKRSTKHEQLAGLRGQVEETVSRSGIARHGAFVRSLSLNAKAP